MAKRTSIDELVDQIAALRQGVIDELAIDLLRSGLGSKHNVVAAKAARVIAARQIKWLESSLAAAFERFLKADSDKGCLAKQAIAEALYETGSLAGEIFEAGARHVQLEASYGGSTDAAAELRGICALGLVRCGHPKLMEILVDLLNDPEIQVRTMACRAVGYAGHDTGALLLRMKILAGDREDDVTAEAFQQLVRLQPRDSLEFIERFLDDIDESNRQSATLALGASRDPEALRILIDRWPRAIDPDDRRLLAVAIATHRSSQAIDFLIQRLADERTATALLVADALQMHRHDAAVWSRVIETAQARGDPSLISACRPAESH